MTKADRQFLIDVCTALEAVVSCQVNESLSTAAVAQVLGSYIPGWQQKYAVAKQESKESDILLELRGKIAGIALELKRLRD